MIELKVIAENAHMLRGELRGLGYWHENEVAEEIQRVLDDAAEKAGEPRPNAPSDPVQPPVPTGDVSANSEPLPRKRGRPRKVVAAEADDTPVPFAEPKVVDESAAAAAAEEHSEYGVVDLPALRRALNAVIEGHSMSAAIRILAHYNAKKVSEVPEARWQEFYSHCEGTVKGAAA